MEFFFLYINIKDYYGFIMVNKTKYVKIIEYIKTMTANYDFSKGKKNPYIKQLKKQVTINLSEEVLDYFKDLSEKTTIPYQTLINFYLLDCVKNKRTIESMWK